MKKYRLLNQSNTEVYPIGLGAMPLSLARRPSEAQALSVIQAFIHGGGNLIDTANVYCIDDADVGHNERLIAKAISKLENSHEIFVATKGGLKRSGRSWTVDGSPAWLRQSCEQSLKDLETDSIFLYQLHSPDPDIPITDSVAELARLKVEGKIQHIGLSNVDVQHIRSARSVTPIISVQNRCNLFERKSFTNGVIEYCDRNNIVFIAHSPVGGHFQHAQRAENILLMKIAAKHQTSSYQIMIAWLLHKNPSIFPIPGASKISSVMSSLGAVNINLSKKEMQLIEYNIK